MTAYEEAVAEVEATATVVEWRGLSLTVPPPAEWAFAFQVAARRNDMGAMADAILGPTQTDEVVAAGHGSIEAFTDLVETLTATAGEA